MLGNKSFHLIIVFFLLLLMASYSSTKKSEEEYIKECYRKTPDGVERPNCDNFRNGVCVWAKCGGIEISDCARKKSVCDPNSNDDRDEYDGRNYFEWFFKRKFGDKYHANFECEVCKICDPVVEGNDCNIILRVNATKPQETFVTGAAHSFSSFPCFMGLITLLASALGMHLWLVRF